jgi:hypothetical protein
VLVIDLLDMLVQARPAKCDLINKQTKCQIKGGGEMGSCVAKLCV